MESHEHTGHVIVHRRSKYIKFLLFHTKPYTPEHLKYTAHVSWDQSGILLHNFFYIFIPLLWSKKIGLESK